MSTSKHTPGPWFVDWEDLDDSPSQLPIRQESTGNMVVNFYHPMFDVSEKDKYNAVLISASPDLLEDLKNTASALRRYCEQEEKETGEHAEGRLELQYAIDAIKKAEGGQ